MKQKLYFSVGASVGILGLFIASVFVYTAPNVYAEDCFGSPTACATPPTVNNFVSQCPDGQVNSGNSGRGANATPNCTPCPPNTVKTLIYGSEACLPPGYVPVYSFDPNIFQIGQSGEICRKDGQHFTGAIGNRLPTRKYDCCGIGVRQNRTAGNSFDYVCENGGAPGTIPVPTALGGSGSGGSGSGGGGSGSGGGGNNGGFVSQCPDGQVNSGNSGRGANATPNCTPCPPNTVKTLIYGSEACLPPGYTPNYSFNTEVFQIGQSGEICRKDGQHFTAAIGDRFPTRKYDCCGLGIRQNRTAGNSYDYVCENGGSGGVIPTPISGGGGGSGGGGSGSGGGGNNGGFVSQCPDGQVNSGNSGRGANATPNCTPCPPNTVKTLIYGGESCQVPGYVPTYSFNTDVFQIGQSGEICRKDGQHFTAAIGNRLPTRKYDCCGIGVRQNRTAGNSFDYVCENGGPPGTVGNLGAGAGAGSGYLASCIGGGKADKNDPGIGVEVKADGTISASVELSGITGAVIKIDGKVATGKNFALSAGQVLTVTVGTNTYTADTDGLKPGESMSVLIPMPCIKVNPQTEEQAQMDEPELEAFINGDGIVKSGIAAGTFQIWYMVKGDKTNIKWKPYTSVFTVQGKGVISAKTKFGDDESLVTSTSFDATPPKKE